MELNAQPIISIQNVQLNNTFDNKTELEKIIEINKEYDFDTLSTLISSILIRKMIEFKRNDIDKYLDVVRVRKRIDGKVKQLFKVIEIK